jgi:hypothetical protein
MTVELRGASGTRFYMDEQLEWRVDLTESTSQSTAGFTEVIPGDEYRIEFGGTADGCIPVRGWPSPFDNSVRFPVRENFLTDLRIACRD